MSDPRCITVFGFGLIGASVALAARARWPALRVIAIDRGAAFGGANARNTADQWIDSDDAVRRKQAFAAADIGVLAAPLAAMEAILPEALDACRVVTDCGSTKRSMLAVAARHPNCGRFVAGHPMAGKPTGGADLADAQLFAERAWILCPERANGEAVLTVTRFIEGLGASVTQMTADQHDRAMALTSHVPQLLASALLVLAERNAVPQAARGPGFESATRVAGGPINIWHDILTRNADHITAHLEGLIAELQQVAQNLRLDPVNAAVADQLLTQARRLRDK
jgi:prephenate dehydrogenase